jgi:putative SOS response-associated peptidase YedK
MRRFVQALSSGTGIADAVPAGVRDALVEFPDRYNIAIRGSAAVVFIQEQRWKVASMSWGLVPSWEKEANTRYSTQTARLARAARCRLFRSSWASRRCVLPINGYYKWDRDSTPRQPWFIQASDGAVLFAAALWSLWGEVDTGLLSFSVLTHENPGIPSPLVPDGPRFVPPARIANWIQAEPDHAARWLLRQPQPDLEAYPVSRRVANRKFDDYSLLEQAAATEAFEAALESGGVDDLDEEFGDGE